MWLSARTDGLQQGRPSKKLHPTAKASRKIKVQSLASRRGSVTTAAEMDLFRSDRKAIKN